MAEYKEFEQCVVCRSIINYSRYVGEFEFTTLLNTLYMTIVFLLEKRRFFLPAIDETAEWLTSNIYVNTYGEYYSSDDLLRMLRNGLAHFNVNISAQKNIIKEIKIDGKNRIGTTVLCSYTFTTEKLSKFVTYVALSYLNKRNKSICTECKYRDFEITRGVIVEENYMFTA